MSTPATTARLHLLALALLCGGLAGAAEHSPWYLGLQQTFTYESNLYRLDDAAQLAGLPDQPRKSDLVSTTSLLAGVDLPFGRQRLVGSATLDALRYRRNAHLDHEAYDVKLGVDWQTVGRLSGSVGIGERRALARRDIVDTGRGVDTTRNLVSQRMFDARVALGLVTRWTAEASLGHREVDYSAPAYRYREYRQDSLSVGLRYRPSDALNLGLAVRQIDGRYPRFRAVDVDRYEADRFTRHDLLLSGQWRPSGASRWDTWLAFGHTGYDQDTRRNHSGVTGGLSWIWQPGGRLQLRTDLVRDTGQSFDYVVFGASPALVDYSRTVTALRVRADYALSAKVALYLSVMQTHRELTDTLSIVGATPSQLTGSDDSTHWLLGTRWTPRASTTLGCELGHERRNADGSLSTDVSAETISCYGRFVLP